MFFYHFFPLKKVQTNQGNKSCWITKGIKVSRQRLQLLRLLKKRMILSTSALDFLKKYKRTYNNILIAAKKVLMAVLF
jgi:Fe2+ or Zn2+ uptake regulation protein